MYRVESSKALNDLNNIESQKLKTAVEISENKRKQTKIREEKETGVFSPDLFEVLKQYREDLKADTVKSSYIFMMGRSKPYRDGFIFYEITPLGLEILQRVITQARNEKMPVFEVLHMLLEDWPSYILEKFDSVIEYSFVKESDEEAKHLREVFEYFRNGQPDN